MERKKIRGQIAWLSFLAEVAGDQDLARLLAQVHKAILSDQTALVECCIRAVCDRRQDIISCADTEKPPHAPELLVERVVG